jgi:hypothetical protein
MLFFNRGAISFNTNIEKLVVAGRGRRGCRRGVKGKRLRCGNCLVNAFVLEFGAMKVKTNVRTR